MQHRFWKQLQRHVNFEIRMFFARQEVTCKTSKGVCNPSNHSGQYQLIFVVAKVKENLTLKKLQWEIKRKIRTQENILMKQQKSFTVKELV